MKRFLIFICACQTIKDCLQILERKCCWMVTKGQRKLGRTIRKLENSVELSTKECRAKAAEIKHNSQAQKAQGYTEDSPVQNLRNIQLRDKMRARTE